jgi:hypothetical protein
LWAYRLSVLVGSMVRLLLCGERRAMDVLDHCISGPYRNRADAPQKSRHCQVCKGAQLGYRLCHNLVACLLVEKRGIFFVYDQR